MFYLVKKRNRKINRNTCQRTNMERFRWCWWFSKKSEKRSYKYIFNIHIWISFVCTFLHFKNVRKKITKQNNKIMWSLKFSSLNFRSVYFVIICIYKFILSDPYNINSNKSWIMRISIYCEFIFILVTISSIVVESKSSNGCGYDVEYFQKNDIIHMYMFNFI